jgi:hypothetical protein
MCDADTTPGYDVSMDSTGEPETPRFGRLVSLDVLAWADVDAADSRAGVAHDDLDPFYDLPW